MILDILLGVVCITYTFMMMVAFMATHDLRPPRGWRDRLKKVFYIVFWPYFMYVDAMVHSLNREREEREKEIAGFKWLHWHPGRARYKMPYYTSTTGRLYTYNDMKRNAPK